MRRRDADGGGDPMIADTWGSIPRLDRPRSEVAVDEFALHSAPVSRARGVLVLAISMSLAAGCTSPTRTAVTFHSGPATASASAPATVANTGAANAPRTLTILG